MINLQAYGADEKVCLTVTLPLAERLIKKFVDDKKIEAEAEVQLYLMVLEKQVFHLWISSAPLNRKHYELWFLGKIPRSS